MEFITNKKEAYYLVKSGYMIHLQNIQNHYLNEIRKAIYTSNAIESVNSVLRKVTNGKGSFASVNSVYKILFLRVEELEEKWKKPIPNWNKIEIQLSEIYKERFTKHLDI